MNDPDLKIIHGYHGHVLKDWIESQVFLDEIHEEGYTLNRKKCPNSNSGISCFQLEIIKSSKNVLRSIKSKTISDAERLNSAKEKLKKGKKLNIFEARAIFDEK